MRRLIDGEKRRCKREGNSLVFYDFLGRYGNTDVTESCFDGDIYYPDKGHFILESFIPIDE